MLRFAAFNAIEKEIAILSSAERVNKVSIERTVQNLQPNFLGILLIIIIIILVLNVCVVVTFRGVVAWFGCFIDSCRHPFQYSKRRSRW